MRYYAGIGSRETPTEILDLMKSLAQFLSADFTLRSGGAKGADLAFEAGAASKEIFLAADATPAAMETVAKYHPAFQWLTPSTQKLMARNAMQVLGADLHTPVEFVLCWTPDGATSTTSAATGGTGQAIRIANAHGIPVWNLKQADHLLYWIGKLATILSVVNVRGLQPGDPGIHYIGRECQGWKASALANMFKISDSCSREHVVYQYRVWLNKVVASGGKYHPEAYAELMELVRLHKAGETIRLGCWCAPLACHGDVVKRAIEYLSR